MKTSATVKSTTRVGTVKLAHTEQELIRCQAKADMPQFSIHAGDIFFLTRSSANDGSYYITHFNEEAARWECSCPSRKPCRHEKLVNAVMVVRCQMARQVTPPSGVNIAAENCNAYARYSAGYADIAC